MSEIKVQSHATNLVSASDGSYLPLKSGNMPYSKANSINELRSVLVDLLDVVECFQTVTKKDASRLEMMGKAYVKQDQNAGQKIS
ncbi:DUF3130 family protein [Listeria seeligeri]|uniref:DUF3130 family protein n=1 Tax=Listeria seeligeri TaxID=1640 RepID=UPI0022EBB136|nr:DUF3130 family protein [Listeria seeligeri]